MRENLTLIPVLNKIDLPSADPDTIIDELENVLAIPREEVILASAKDGTGVGDILEAIVARIPAPKGDRHAPRPGPDLRQPLRRLQGRHRLCPARPGHAPRPRRRAADGQRRGGRPARARRLPATARAGQAARRGRGRLRRDRPQERARGAGRRHRHDPRPTRRPSRSPATSRPRASSSRASTRSAARTTRSCARRSTSSTSTTRASPSSRRARVALGFGFRCGFLGLLHMEIVQERLEREFGLDLIASAPSVEYHVQLQHGRGTVVVDNPALLPDPADDRVDRGAVGQAQRRHAERLHRPAHGALDEPARAVREHGVPGPDAGRPPLRDAPGRAHRRLLRPAQEPQPGLRLDGLRGARLSRGEPGQGRHPGQRRAGRRAVDHRPPRPRPDAPVGRWRSGSSSSSRARCSRSRSRPPSAATSSPARPSERCARTSSPSVTVATSPASASCSRSRRKASSA